MYVLAEKVRFFFKLPSSNVRSGTLPPGAGLPAYGPAFQTPTSRAEPGLRDVCTRQTPSNYSDSLREFGLPYITSSWIRAREVGVCAAVPLAAKPGPNRAKPGKTGQTGESVPRSAFVAQKCHFFRLFGELGAKSAILGPPLAPSWGPNGTTNQQNGGKSRVADRQILL